MRPKTIALIHCVLMSVLALMATASAQAAPTAKKDPTYLDAFKILTPNFPARAGAWRVAKTSWDSEDEREFSAFVAAIGSSKCGTVDACLKNPKINKYFDPVENGVFYYADCGRFPYMLRMYFAWKKGLPFSAVTSKTGTPEDVEAWIEGQRKAGISNPNIARDYPTDKSPNGNLMMKRRSVPADAQNLVNFFEYGRFVINRVNSSNFRFDTDATMPEAPDFYPVEVARGAIRPGTVVYDPQGHVAVVYDISSSGEISLVESHPGNSVTRKKYNRTFRRSRPSHGAGFKNWRPLKVETDARIAGGQREPLKLTLLPNEKLRHFSKVQFYGNQPDPSGKWTKGVFVIEGRKVDFHEFVQFKLADKGFRLEPVSAFRSGLNDICLSWKDRVKDVQKAVDHGISLAPHQEKMPKNIYSDEGTWENNSTPGRDLRLRQLYSETLGMAQNHFMRLKRGDPSLDYDGSAGDYRQAILAALDEYERDCAITYRNSRGASVRIGFSALLLRLTSISFDPYHCPERRWGESGQGLASCVETADKAKWYEAQKYYRHALEKDPSQTNNFDLEEQILENDRRVPLIPKINYDLRAELQKLN